MYTPLFKKETVKRRRWGWWGWGCSWPWVRRSAAWSAGWGRTGEPEPVSAPAAASLMFLPQWRRPGGGGDWILGRVWRVRGWQNVAQSGANDHKNEEEESLYYLVCEKTRKRFSAWRRGGRQPTRHSSERAQQQDSGWPGTHKRRASKGSSVRLVHLSYGRGVKLKYIVGKDVKLGQVMGQHWYLLKMFPSK